MPGNVESKILPNFTNIHNFLEEGIHLLVAQDRQEPVLIHTLRVISIPIQDGQTGRQQRDPG
jgi:hypothetical protein